MKATRNRFVSNLFVLLGAALALVFSACDSQSPEDPIVVQVYITATSRPPTITPSPSPTSTPSPTPTATAPAVSIHGDPRTQAYRAPSPEPGAYCGFVDTFDFPLDPPDAVNVRGGQDFGVFRSRYDKYHAGEDWGTRGGSAFGEPVHAIGHGTVTYADGLGWGPDQGVVVIRHYFPDGSTLLSFYGHLDPPSVTLLPGQCVERGSVVGNIGRPRTPPHLHFEIRTIFPFVAGPGYWSEDPTTAGWLPPSETIWLFRMASNPAMRWADMEMGVQALLGWFAEDTFLIRRTGALAAIYAPAGGLRWIHPLDGLSEVAVSQSSGKIYTLSLTGILQGLRLPGPEDVAKVDAYLIREWEVEASGSHPRRLAALPWGGVAVISAGGVTGYDPDGSLVWSYSASGIPIGVQVYRDKLYVSYRGEEDRLLAFGTAGLEWEAQGEAGVPRGAESGVYVLSPNGLFRAVPEREELELVRSLPTASRPGEIAVLADGRSIVLHHDVFDTRLMLFDADGSLLWERSVADALDGSGRVAVVGDRVYLAAQRRSQYSLSVYVYRVSLGGPGLTLVFDGGTRATTTGELLLSPSGDGALLLRFGDGVLVVIDDPEV